jgi:tagaturonate epimerase
MLPIESYTFGVGDRFAHQGRAQLQAVVQARDLGIPVHPVWSKSYREHSFMKTKPDDVLAEADAAVRALRWTGAYHVDADHISRKNVSEFMQASNFFPMETFQQPYSMRPATRSPWQTRSTIRLMEGG